MAWNSEESTEALRYGGLGRLREAVFGRDRRKRRAKEGVTGEFN